MLGGARSGKSAHAETLLVGQEAVDYLATREPEPEESEWAERIARHREHRPEHWCTVDVRTAGVVADVLGASGGAVLVDSVTAWLSLVMREAGLWSAAGDAKDRLAAEIDRMAGAWAATQRLVVAVTDEVGLGLAPEPGPQRLFRDVLGLLNQRMAASSDEVWMVAAGVATQLR